MNIFEAWKKAKAYLEPALVETKGTHEIDDVCLMVGSGHFTLWVGEKCAALTEFCQTPRIKSLNCFAVGGDLEELRRMEVEKLIPFAKEHGCSRITGAGRKGWARVRSDWADGGVYMHKDI
jgi:hypothetical protein